MKAERPKNSSRELCSFLSWGDAECEPISRILKHSRFKINNGMVNKHFLHISKLARFKMNNDKFNCIIGTTVKGKGVSFMENNNDWHHNKLTEEDFNLAMKELK